MILIRNIGKIFKNIFYIIHYSIQKKIIIIKCNICNNAILKY